MLVEDAMLHAGPAGSGIDSAYFIAVPEESEALLGNLVEWAAKRLEDAGHRAGDQFPLHLIALAIALGPAHPHGSAGAMRSLLERIEPASATLAYSPALPLPPFTIGRFTCSRFVPDEWKERGYIAGTDFFSTATYRNQWADRAAIVWSPPNVVTIAPALLAEESSYFSTHVDELEACEQLFTRYLCRYGMTLQEEFWRAFEEEQAPLVAAGAAPLNPQHLRRGFGASMAFCLFEGFRTAKGWCAPVNEQPAVFLDEALVANARRLRERFGLEVPFRPTTRLERVLNEYARLVTRAKLHESEGREDEAFLHFIIALDTAFGSARNTTQTIADRVDRLLARAVPGLQLHASDIKKLYDYRSRYVHDGIVVPRSAFKRAGVVCEAVFGALLSARADPRFAGQDGFQLLLDSLTPPPDNRVRSPKRVDS